MIYRKNDFLLAGIFCLDWYVAFQHSIDFVYPCAASVRNTLQVVAELKKAFNNSQIKIFKLDYCKYLIQSGFHCYYVQTKVTGKGSKD